MGAWAQVARVPVPEDVSWAQARLAAPERAFDRAGVVAGTVAVSAPWPLRRTPRSEQSPPRGTACAHYRVPAKLPESSAETLPNRRNTDFW